MDTAHPRFDGFGLDGIHPVRQGRIVEIEGQGAGDHQGFGFVDAHGEADGAGGSQGSGTGGGGLKAQGAIAEIEVLEGVAHLARHLIDGGGAGDGALARIFFALDLIRSLACGLGGAVLAEGQGATPVLQLGVIAGAGADAVGRRSRQPRGGIRRSDRVGGAVSQLQDIHTSCRGEPKGRDPAAPPITQTVAGVFAEILVRGLEGAGGGNGRDAAALLGDQGEVGIGAELVRVGDL